MLKFPKGCLGVEILLNICYNEITALRLCGAAKSVLGDSMSKYEKEFSFEEFAAKVAEILNKDDGWIEQYKGYAKIIDDKENSIKAIAEDIKKKLRSEDTGLYLYTTISGLKNGAAFDLRYQGESIAAISNTNIKLKISSGNYTIREFIGDDDWKNIFEQFTKPWADLTGALKIFTDYFTPDLERHGRKRQIILNINMKA